MLVTIAGACGIDAEVGDVDVLWHNNAWFVDVLCHSFLMESLSVLNTALSGAVPSRAMYEPPGMSDLFLWLGMLTGPVVFQIG